MYTLRTALLIRLTSRSKVALTLPHGTHGKPGSLHTQLGSAGEAAPTAWNKNDQWWLGVSE